MALGQRSESEPRVLLFFLFRGTDAFGDPVFLRQVSLQLESAPETVPSASFFVTYVARNGNGSMDARSMGEEAMGEIRIEMKKVEIFRKFGTARTGRSVASVKVVIFSRHLQD